MEVRGEPGAQATLPPGKQPQVSNVQLTMVNVMGNRNWSVWIKEMKKKKLQIHWTLSVFSVYLHHIWNPQLMFLDIMFNVRFQWSQVNNLRAIFPHFRLSSVQCSNSLLPKQTLICGFQCTICFLFPPVGHMQNMQRYVTYAILLPTCMVAMAV
jgi:hypothetical protein